MKDLLLFLLLGHLILIEFGDNTGLEFAIVANVLKEFEQASDLLLLYREVEVFTEL